MGLDVYGSFGDAVAADQNAAFDPAGDMPDSGPRDTVFQSMPFLCRTQAGTSRGHWLETGRMEGVEALAEGDSNRMVSRYTVEGIEVELEVSFECNLLSQCYTFTNATGADLEGITLTPYLDGDLEFVAGGNNDYGGVSQDAPRTVYEFDAGDSPDRPTSLLALTSLDPNDANLIGWEVGEYDDSYYRIATTRNGCAPLRQALIDQDREATDLNGDLVTDRGYDVTLALQFTTGPLAAGATGPTLCYGIRWGYGLACSDEDDDFVCLADDNCPTRGNPDQTDRDQDGVGDACDNCPLAPNPGQEDLDGNGRGEACNECVPIAEICNDLDDDCDGSVDEQIVGIGAPCDQGRPGVCGEGERICRDGAITCVSNIEPSDEACDGLDNDCDSLIDEGLPGTGEVCDSGLPGVCAEGVRVCDPETGAVICRFQTDFSPEVCDLLDNDCDGEVDESIVGETANCDAGGVGVCGVGLTVCAEGLAQCQPSDAQGDEICDALDNDCDGVIDEGVERNACNACGPPLTEVCDGIDDDCDGNLDEDAPCPGDSAVCSSIAGRCSYPCNGGECRGNDICADGVCVSRCEATPCEEGLACNRAAGECFDPCAEVRCQAGFVCVDGDCVFDNCFASGCPDGQRCRNDACEPDPCIGVTCEEGTFCRDGACIPSCATVACRFNEVCVDGECIEDACGALACPPGQACINGRCTDDLCAGVTCALAQICRAGVCFDDPCYGVSCPLGQVCIDVNRTAQCVLADAPDTMDPEPEPDPGPGPAIDGGASPMPAADAGVSLVDAGPSEDAERDPPTDDADTPSADQGFGTPVARGTTGRAESSCDCDATRGNDLSPIMALALLLGWRRRRGQHS